MNSSRASNCVYGDPGLASYLAGRHGRVWEHMLELTGPCLASDKVLDFGCSTGEFLHLLYQMSPFSSGVGVDLAEASIAAAKEQRGGLPVEYLAAGDTTLQDTLLEGPTFDRAYSHEVIYQLADLRAHAHVIAEVLSSGGSYFAVTGCHTDNPLWELWKKLRDERGTSTAFPHYDYSPDEIVESFRAGGFSSVNVTPFSWDPPGDFELVPADPERAAFWPSEQQAREFYRKHKLLFTCVLD